MKCRCCLEISHKDILLGIVNITTLSELYVKIVNKSLRELIIDLDFAETFFTPAGLSEFIRSLGYINNRVSVTVDETYLLNSNVILDKLSSLQRFEDLVSFCFSNRDKVLHSIKEMNLILKERFNKEFEYSHKLNNLAMQIIDLKNKLEIQETNIEQMKFNYNELRTQFDIITSRIKFRYKKRFEENSLLQISNNNNSFKKILYVKEISRVKYVDSLLFQLSEILKSLYKEPVRIIVIEPIGSYDRTSLYCNFKSHIDLTVRDVISSNIHMAGFQSELMLDILKNPENMSFLIILDRNLWHSPHVKCNNLVLIHTSSDINDVDESLTSPTIISYEDNTLHIPHIENFNSLSDEEKIQKYSSLHCMKHILKLLEVVA